jgi:hypothetical protein
MFKYIIIWAVIYASNYDSKSHTQLFIERTDAETFFYNRIESVAEIELDTIQVKTAKGKISPPVSRGVVLKSSPGVYNGTAFNKSLDSASMVDLQNFLVSRKLIDAPRRNK